MAAKVLIVEDEFLVAANLQAVIEELGYTTVGIAPDRRSALTLADQKPDLALVDVNLNDGPTGPEIGEKLAEMGVSVMYVTANPRMLGDGIPGTFGVMHKPCDGWTIKAALEYVLNRRSGQKVAAPPFIRQFGAA